MNLTFVYIFIVILVLLIIIGNISNNMQYQQIEEQLQVEDEKKSNFEYEQDSKLYLSSPTRCFDCERQMINPRSFMSDFAWMGKPTKCFDCEKELIKQQGDFNAGNLGHGTKCFSCEKKMNKYINPSRNSPLNCYGYYNIN